MTSRIVPRDSYVYTHHKATTGEIFYVGKGVAHRAWGVNGRSAWWHKTVAKHGLEVRIAQDGLQEWAAHELECDLIALHGRRDIGLGPLCNLSDGGEGNAGHAHTDETIRKMVAARTGRKNTPETIARMQAAHKALYRSPERIQALRERNVKGGKPVICNGILVFRSLTQAAEWVGRKSPAPYAKGNICDAVKRKGTAYGYTWAYADTFVAD